MKAVILAGGLGTRLKEETEYRPKPMVEVGDRPIIWHIMKIYAANGINDFVVCLGYKGYLIKEYFVNYALHMSDLTIDLASNKMSIHRRDAEPWSVTLVDTGSETMTGGRIKRILDYVKDDEAFCMTYGDGVGNIDIAGSIRFHREHGRLATMTVVRPYGRYGVVQVNDDDAVGGFQEKPAGDGVYINGGFFVLSPEVARYLDNDSTVWEQRPLQGLLADNQLMAWKHGGFWQCMDTLRDKALLDDLWTSGKAPWKVW